MHVAEAVIEYVPDLHTEQFTDKAFEKEPAAHALQLMAPDAMLLPLSSTV